MIRTVISDLGNVLVHFDHRRSCRSMAALCDRSPEQIYEKMFKSGLETDYDLGRISSEDFGHEIIELLDLSVDLDTVRRIWADIFWPLEGMEALVRSLKKSHRLLLLSNTNEWHFHHCLEKFPFLQLFDDFVLSFKVGARKPDPAVFLKALQVAGASPDECVYIDDIDEFVKAARKFGIQGIRFEDPSSLGAELKSLGMVF